MRNFHKQMAIRYVNNSSWETLKAFDDFVAVVDQLLQKIIYWYDFLCFTLAREL